MAIAWSKDKVGKASGDVMVRDPVVLTATLPRFLLVGDQGTMHLDLDNVEGQSGDYSIAVTSEGAVSVGERMTQTLRLRAKQRDFVAVPLAVGVAGVSNVKVRVTGPGRLFARARLSAQRQAGNAGSHSPHRAPAGARREPDAVERRLRRSRSRHGKRCALGRRLDRARRGGFAEGARPLSLWLHRADHQPRAAAPLCQRARERTAARARQRGRSAHPRCDRPRAGAARLERVVRAVVGRRRGHLA